MDPDNLDMTKLKGNDRKMAKQLDKAKGRSTRHLYITKIEEDIAAKKIEIGEAHKIALKELDDAKTAFAKISLKHKDKQKAQKDVLTAVESFYQTLKNQPGIFSSGKSTALATSEKDSWYQNTKYAHLVNLF